MKKTSFTFAETQSKVTQWHSFRNMRSFVSFLALMLIGNFAFGQIMDICPGGSGNVVSNCPPAGPVNVIADANCQIAIPELKFGADGISGGVGANADVSGTAGPGYSAVGAIQDPMAGTIVSLSNIPAGGTNLTVQVGYAFFNPAAPPMEQLCAVLCTDVTVNVTDNTQPIVSCAVPPAVSVGPACSFTIDTNYVRNSLLSGYSDNCTGGSDLTFLFNAGPYTVDPVQCGFNTPFIPGNPQPPATTHMITIQARDAAGNLSLSCSATLTLVDDIGPDVTFGDFTGAPAGGSFSGKNMTVGTLPGLCQGQIPDIQTYANIVVNSDNCQPAPPFTIIQFPAAGSPFMSSCPGNTIPVTVTVYDCWKNTTQQVYNITITDLEDPIIGSTCLSLSTDPGFPALPLVTNGNCEITVPDLRPLLLLSDNCTSNANLTVTQTPAPGTLDVSGLCPPNNVVAVSFTVTDECNNSTNLDCPALLTFTDNTPPVIACPATPIPVIVPFDGATCQINMTQATIADAIAGGVTITDACDPMPMLTMVTSQMFTCSDIGKAGLTIDIDGQDCFGNPALTATCAVDIRPDVDLTAAWTIQGGNLVVCPTTAFPICIELGPNTPTCGVWSGDVVVSASAGCASTFELQAASFPDADLDGVPDAGDYSLTYTVGPVGCHAEITHNIMISPQFNPGDAALVDNFSICLESEEVFDLEGLLEPGSIDGGTFTINPTGAVTGTLTGSLWQYQGGDGTLEVTYTLTDCDNAVESDIVILTIDEKPAGHFSLATDMCQDEGEEVPTITDVPAGATVVFTSNPAGFIIQPNPGDYRFDPAAGPLAGEYVDVLVTMTVSNGVCPDFSVTQTVRVYESGDPSFTLQATVCETSPPLTLTLTNPDNDQAGNTTNLVTPPNVTWTGTSVTDNGNTGSFDPSVGPGIYTVCVTVGNPGCEEVQCHDIEVLKDYTADDVRLVDDVYLCMFPDDIIDFESLLGPAVWSGTVLVSSPALTGGVFDVTVGGTITGTDNGDSYTYTGGCGTLTINYYFPQDCDPAGGPPTSDQLVITIEEKPDIGGFSVPGPMCAQDPPILIDYSGTPEVCGNPGVFSGPGITDYGTGTTAEFNPAAAGEGVHTIMYEIGNPMTGCYQQLFFQITVNASSDPSFVVPSQVCANEVVNLALANPNFSVSATPSLTYPLSNGIAEVEWFGGDGLNAVVTDNGDGTATFVGYVSGTYTVCVQTGAVGCGQFECHQITVDITPPVMNCGPVVRTRSNDAGLCSYASQLTEFDVTATDNCIPPNGVSSLVLTHNYAPHLGVNANSLADAVFPVGITQVVWTATDTAGNSANCTIQIVVNDTEDPTVTSCPTSFVQGTDADICGAGITYVLPQFADNCDGPNLEGVLVNGYAPGTDFPVGVTTVTWEYTDLADNMTAVCTFTVTINDDDDPTPICVNPIEVSLDEDGSYQLLVSEVDNGSYDNCQITSMAISRDGGATYGSSVSFDCADQGQTITVTLRAIDAATNEATCTSQVTVVDEQVPDIECPGNFTVLNDAGLCSAVVTYVVTVTDNCPTTLTQIDLSGLTSGDPFPVGTTVQTWRAQDAAGNTEECSFEITVLDQEPPTVNCAPTVRTRNNDAGLCAYTAVLAEFDGTSNDNCPGWTFTHDYGPAPSTTTLAGAVFPVGITDVLWTATDVAGNHTTCTVQINIIDAEGPTVQSCPGNIAVGTDPGICGALIDYDEPQFADNCDGVDLEGVLINGYAPGTVFPLGTTTVTWTYTDLADNSTAVCTFTVTITDDENPVAICVGDYTVALDGNGNFTILVTDIDNGSYDNCGVASRDISRDGVTYGSTVLVDCDDVTTGPVTITLRIKDAAGNTSYCTTDVTVEDNQVPDIECTGNITVTAVAPACSALVVYPAPTVTDNCNTTVTQIDGSGLTSGDMFPVGSTVQTYQVTDIAGNSETCTFTIFVYDEVAPTINCGPSVRTVSADQGLCSFTMPGAGFDAIGDDNCPGVYISHNYPFAVDPNTLAGSTFPVGSTTVTWVASDASGNQSAICGIEIIVIDDQDPTINCGAGAPANLLLNGSFESPAVHDAYCSDDWTCFGAAFKINSALGFPPAQDGTYYMKTFGGASGLFQDFPAAAGDELFGSAYLMNASFDPMGAGQFGLVKYEFYNAGNTKISEVEGPMFFAGDLPTNVWTQATVNAIAPAGTVSARFVVVSVAPAGGAVMFDAANANFGPGGVSGNITVDSDPGVCGADLDINNPLADDNCGIVSIINDFNYTQNASGFYPVGTTVVGFTATDASGNTAECTITVTVEDNEDPVFVNCPTTMVMIGNDPDECTGKLNWSIPVADDNCGIQSVVKTAGPNPGTPVPVGLPMTVTYTATDVNGNTSTCSFDVQVVDTQDPEYDADIVMPGDITVECDAVPPVFILTNNDVYDNCTASNNLVIVNPTFPGVSTQGTDPNNCNYYNYTLTRTWTITDEAGNVTTHVQVITVEDTTPPVPTCQGTTITLDLFGTASIDPVALIAGTTDNCAPFSALTVTASQINFDCSDLGNNSVTLTIKDPCGNTATCTVNVEVVEGIAPCTPEYDINGSDPCVCLDNATNLDNGQFSELIQIKSLAGQTWTVASATNMYTAGSAAPPAAPTPLAIGTGFVNGGVDGLDNDNDGLIDGADADEIIYYTLSVKTVDGKQWNGTFTNGIGGAITMSNVCYYPTPIFTNLDDPFCFNTPAFTPEVSDVYAGAGAYTSVSFEIDGQPATVLDASTLAPGQHTIKVTVDAGTPAASRYVNGVLVPGDAATPQEARLDPGCVQMYTETFFIVTTPSQVTCNDEINVTLEADCVSEITQDMVLEGTYPCFDDYTVEIYLPGGVPLNPSNIVNGSHVGQSLSYILVHPISGNTCWGTINVEDKTPPVPTCPDNVTVLCVVDPDSVVYGVPFNHPDYPAKDYWGKVISYPDSALYLGHPTATDCSDLLPLWTFNDDYTTFDCVADPAKIADIVRTFVVEDEWGNYSTCTQNITWKRGEFGDVEWPLDIHIACNFEYLDEIIDGNYTPDVLEEYLANVVAWPFIWGPNDSRLSLYDNGICGLGLTYSDQQVNLCASSWKIVRTWTLYDWCPETGQPTTHQVVQNIKIENLAPVIEFTTCTVPGAVGCMDPNSGMFIMNANLPGNLPHYACAAAYVPFATIDAVCDQLVEVSVETPLGNTTNGGALPSPGLPLGGPYEITYRAEDKCGNITLRTIQVMVVDKTAPVAICDEITDVNLGANGLAKVFAETFDDGSYDGCALDHFEVRRMSDNCGISGNTSFGPSVTFCCEDVANNPITVEFRAVDHNNNTNSCMVQVYVQDKIPPILVSCPANQRISCDLYASNFETQLANAADEEEQCDILSAMFGSPVFQDNCPINAPCDVNINLDQCLEGTIRRTWVAQDDGGNSSIQCTQIISVDHVSDWVIEFPADKTIECGTTPPDFGEPEIFYETCELVAVSYEDEIFTTVADACYKVLRTWTVINWCVVGNDIDQEVVETPENQLGLVFPLCDLDGDGDCDNRTFRDSWNLTSKPNANDATKVTGPDTDLDSDPWDGYITYQQTIKVNDTVDPVFTNGCDIPDVCIGSNDCVASFTLPTPDIDECSFEVSWTVTSDMGQGFGPYHNVAPGTYNVRYVANDNCNNQTACETTVTVVDCKLPTPYCKNGIVVELMVPVFPNDIPMVEVWASDLDAASFDNCPGDLIFSFSENTSDLSVVLTCADLNGQLSAEVPVTIYVTDASGNQDYCETVIHLQANQNQCDDDPLVAMNGLISTEEQEGVQDVDVQLSGTSQLASMTDVDGMFSFNVPLGGDYTITPLKDDNPLNGVTTFDLVKITKHILAVDLLDSPYKMIAADANKSNSITTFDLVQIRKLILFIDTEFPNNTSWRFVDRDYVFPNPSNPWSQVFPEVINYNNVAQSTLDADFVAIKIGDVNSSAQTNFAAAGDDRNMVGSLVFNVDDRKLNAGEEFTVEFTAKDFDVLGYQFTLNFDQKALEFVQVTPAVAKAEHFGLALLEKGAITTSWNDNNVKLADGEVVFSLVFRALSNVKLSDAFTANSRYTAAEAYKPNGDLLDIELAFNGQTVAGAFELYQNTPNPFSNSTVIGFNMPEAATATLTITDVSGKVVKVVEGDYTRGYNEIRLERQGLPATGILYYQLDTPTDSATKMMLLVD